MTDFILVFFIPFENNSKSEVLLCFRGMGALQEESCRIKWVNAKRKFSTLFIVMFECRSILDLSSDITNRMFTPFLLALLAESHYIAFTIFDCLLLCRNWALPTNHIIRFSSQWINRITENHWKFEGNYEAWIKV